MAATSPMDRFREATGVITPARMLVLLYERLLRDIEDAEHALSTGDRYGAHRALLHAQEIVAELDGALNPEVWPSATQMSQLYRYLSGRLVDANVTQDRRALRESHAIVVPLLEAWREAWQQQQTSGPAVPGTPTATDPDRPRVTLDIAG